MDQSEGRAIRQSTPPVAFFFLVLPYGISSGFVSITLPFFLTKAGFSVAAAGAIVAVGVSANLWLFLWGPLADLTFTPKRWYLVGLRTFLDLSSKTAAFAYTFVGGKKGQAVCQLRRSREGRSRFLQKIERQRAPENLRPAFEP